MHITRLNFNYLCMRKRLYVSVLSAVLVATIVWAGDIPTKFFVWVQGAYTAYSIDTDSINFRDDSLTIAGTTFAIDKVDSITFSLPMEDADTIVTEPLDTLPTGGDVDTIRVTYIGNTALVTTLPEGVTGTIEGADVSLASTITTRELVCVLSGSSPSGSFTYDGDYKMTVRLEGLTLKGSTEEAIHIRCGKRIALELAEGTDNSLEDASTDGGQKGAFYTKGHLEISGAGTLTLRGNVKHALSSKEYLLVKKTAGTINITGAASDGIHAGEYVQINGGKLNIKGVKADGIQAEAVQTTPGESIEDNGKLIVKGGVIDVTTTSNDVAALKADSTLHIKDGQLTLSCSGNGSKCMKSDVDVHVEGGTMTLTQSGGLYEDSASDNTGNTSKSYKVYVTTGSNNKYWPSIYLYKSDGTLVEKLTSTVTKTVNNQNLTFYYYDFKQATSGNYYFRSDDYYSSYYGTTYTVISPTFAAPTSGSDVYYQITSTYNINGTVRTHTMNTVTPGTSTTTTASDLSSSHGIKGDGGVHVEGGNITMNLSGVASKGISSDKNVTISGGTINITNTGAGQTSGTTTYTAKGITSNGNVWLQGGDITLSISGTGGKGIKADGTYTQGTQDGNGPTLRVTTTGAALGGSTTGGMGGGNRPGGGSTSSGGSSSKAIKAQGVVTIYGGETEVSTSTNGAEGLESKTSINIAGGKHYFKCYDDCINSSGNIVFNGGVTVCYGYGNDAVDSNAGRTGAITIGDGVCLAYTTKGSPEEGFDCDNNSYIVVSGKGIGLSAGGTQGGGGGWGGSSGSSTIGSAVQGYGLLTSSISYTSGRYYTLSDASGRNLVTYSFEASVNSTLALITATGMTKGSTYNLKYSSTAPADATTAWHGLYLGSSATGTTSVTSFTAN